MPDNDRPLYNAIKAYVGQDPARFHMSGHKGFLLPDDVTELTGTDNLACPSGAIARLEELCADAFGARYSLISVNGSTACNIAMLLALGEGKRILLGRNCHKSAISGLALAGHEALPLFPDGDGIVTPEQVADALENEPCDAVFITSPTYRGAVCDIAGIAEAAHAKGALLLVDCAHGAHFAFGKLLPAPPVEADLWCVSCHKTLYAMNQAAALCAGESCPFDKQALRNALGAVQTTSPSYPIMLSIERAIVDCADWDGHVGRIRSFCGRLGDIPEAHILYAASAYEEDPTRLNISIDGLTGYSQGRILEKNNVYPEMSDMRCVTLITTPHDRDEWYDMLYSALRAAAGSADRNGDNTLWSECAPVITAGERVLSVREATFSKTEKIELGSSAGRVAACAAGVYPPGTAALFPGERRPAEAVEYLLRQREAGAELFGLDGGMVSASVCGEE